MTAHKEVFQLFMLKAFNIRSGELQRAGLMQLNIFLIISTLLIVKPTVNGLFLSKLGVENLPKVFILVAVTAALVSSAYSRIIHRFSLGRVIGSTLFFSVFSLLIFGTLFKLNLIEGAILYAFYVWVAVFALLATSQFWILANMVFNTREAKRLFGFIGAGAIAGGIFGGYLTSILAPLIGSESLLFVGAALLTGCIPITRYIWKHQAALKPKHYREKKKDKGFSAHPFNLIRSSKHLTYMASIVGVSVLVAKLVDYQFSAVASSVITDQDELTSFFGFWFSNLNLVSLMVQLFITSRVVGTFGVGTSLFFLPGGILIGAVALLFFPELWAAILIKVCDGSLKQSINRASVELLALPIPLAIKNQTKTFIDVFVDSLATGIGGLILIFVVTGLNLPTHFISLIIIGLIVIWGYFALKIRKEYIKSFKLKIVQKKEDDKDPLDLADASVIGGLTKVLRNGSEQQILYVLSAIRDFRHDQLFVPVKSLLTHASPAIRREALRNLYFYSKPNISNEVEKLTADADQEVKIEAFEYLIEHAPLQTIDLMTKYLDDPDYRVHCAALISLAKETKDNPSLKSSFDLGRRIKEKLELIPSVDDPEMKKFYTTNILRVIGRSNLPYFHQNIEQFFSHNDPEIVNEAILAAGVTVNSEFIAPLTRFLEEKAFSANAVTALSGYGQGILPVLDTFILQKHASAAAIRQIPAVAAQIPAQRSVDFLFQLIDYEDHLTRLNALRALNLIKRSHAHLNFHQKSILDKILEEARLYLNTLSVLYAQSNAEDEIDAIADARTSLVDLLERRLDGNLERIFRLLGLKYPPEDIIPIYEGLVSKKPDMRINAIEFLDNLLEPNLNRILLPIVETALLEKISADAIKHLDLKIPNEYECFQLLLKAKDVKIKLAVLYMIRQLAKKEYLPLAKEQAASTDKKIQTFADLAIKAISGA